MAAFWPSNVCQLILSHFHEGLIALPKVSCLRRLRAKSCTIFGNRYSTNRWRSVRWSMLEQPIWYRRRDSLQTSSNNFTVRDPKTSSPRVFWVAVSLKDAYWSHCARCSWRPTWTWIWYFYLSYTHTGASLQSHDIDIICGNVMSRYQSITSYHFHYGCVWRFLLCRNMM